MLHFILDTVQIKQFLIERIITMKIVKEGSLYFASFCFRSEMK